VECQENTKLSEQKIVVGPPKVTRFEKARIIGARALQISMGAPILVDAAENTNPIDIAMCEMEATSFPSQSAGPYQTAPSKTFPLNGSPKRHFPLSRFLKKQLS